MDESQDMTGATVDEVDAGRPTATTAVASAARATLAVRGIRRMAGGIGAVGVKELRGRMRGRRAFVILTLYLVLLGRLRLDARAIMERTVLDGVRRDAAYASRRRSARASSPACSCSRPCWSSSWPRMSPPERSASSARSRPSTCWPRRRSPRSRSSWASSLSALIYVFLLIAASIPLTAVVFVFGGVGPDDLVRGYIVLVVTALGFGAFGLFCSSLVKRTQAATAITIFGVLGGQHRDALRHRLLAGARAPTNVGRGTGPVAADRPGSDRLPEPVPRPGGPRPGTTSCARRTTRCATTAGSATGRPDRPERRHLRHRRRGSGRDDLQGRVRRRRRRQRSGRHRARRSRIARRPAAAGSASAGGRRPGSGPRATRIWPQDRDRLARSCRSSSSSLSVQFVSPTRRWRLRRGPTRRPEETA